MVSSLAALAASDPVSLRERRWPRWFGKEALRLRREGWGQDAPPMVENAGVMCASTITGTWSMPNFLAAIGRAMATNLLEPWEPRHRSGRIPS